MRLLNWRVCIYQSGEFCSRYAIIPLEICRSAIKMHGVHQALESGPYCNGQLFGAFDFTVACFPVVDSVGVNKESKIASVQSIDTQIDSVEFWLDNCRTGCSARGERDLVPKRLDKLTISPPGTGLVIILTSTLSASIR
ncbi:hypothetical protein SAMN05216302_10296 [Nitrosomonas aestuarii]|uniref:Uncharacterized protein n=1 Tax=Nitrosomonas aestuarii TaxID=52441 RepID=A0A1I4EJT2_9PROT|nr:hypothetical protein SAMN05216302_10296 [Nitrosomonas aestuarii]